VRSLPAGHHLGSRQQQQPQRGNSRRDVDGASRSNRATSRLTPILCQGYVVGYGYDDSGVYVFDPAIGGTRAWSWGDFLWMWNALEGMALAVWPAT
jgi:hypothetical protein